MCVSEGGREGEVRGRVEDGKTVRGGGEKGGGREYKRVTNTLA